LDRANYANGRKREKGREAIPSNVPGGEKGGGKGRKSFNSTISKELAGGGMKSWMGERRKSCDFHVANREEGEKASSRAVIDWIPGKNATEFGGKGKKRLARLFQNFNYQKGEGKKGGEEF